MDYWRCMMNWPLDSDWKCEVCGQHSPLTWGLTHGHCRCDVCHTQYNMRIGHDILTRPRCALKPEYLLPAQHGWRKFFIPISEWTDEMWDEAFEEVVIGGVE